MSTPLLTALLALSIPSTALATVTIDDFSVGEYTLSGTGGENQLDLPRDAVASGSREIWTRSVDAETRVNTTSGRLEFSTVATGYLSLDYRFGPGEEIDLLADGSTHFRLIFADVGPGQWRGLYRLNVDGVPYSFGQELFALNGAGVIDIPFSHYTDQSTFAPSRITLDVARVEPGFSFAIDSFTTVPEPTTPLLASLGMALIGIRRRVAA